MNTPFVDTQVPVIRDLDISTLPEGEVSRLKLEMIADGLGRPIRMPLMVARGSRPGPVLGLTAAVHGNELNGVPVIQRLLAELNLSRLSGAVVAVPVVNIPGLLEQQRAFNDDRDLNHLFPGRANGTSAEVWAWRFMERVVSHMEFLVDLHTASFGRVNSLYIRANLADPVVARMARLQNPEIIVHNPPADGTLRGAAEDRGIPGITVELRDPHRFQHKVIRQSVMGLRRVMVDLKMLPHIRLPAEHTPLICRRSYWIYSPIGGLLTVLPGLTERVKAGEVIARVTNIYGDLLHEHLAPEDGVVIGKSLNPVSQTGSRVLHLGLPGEPELEEME